MRQGLDLSSDLRPDFIQQLDTLRSRVLDAAPLKRVDGTNINGTMLVSLTKAYVNAMNSNSVLTHHGCASGGKIRGRLS